MLSKSPALICENPTGVEHLWIVDEIGVTHNVWEVCHKDRSLREVEPLDSSWSGGGVRDGHGADAGQALHLRYGGLGRICQELFHTNIPGHTARRVCQKRTPLTRQELYGSLCGTWFVINYKDWLSTCHECLGGAWGTSKSTWELLKMFLFLLQGYHEYNLSGP